MKHVATVPPTDPPAQPTDADIEILGAAQRVELAALALYDVTLSSVDWASRGEGVRTTMLALRDSHEAYARSISGLIGRLAPNEADDELVEDRRADVASADDAVVALWQLEADLVETHTQLLDVIQSPKTAGIIASILVAEARHGTVLADIAQSGNGEGDIDLFLVSEGGTALVEA